MPSTTCCFHDRGGALLAPAAAPEAALPASLDEPADTDDDDGNAVAAALAACCCACCSSSRTDTNMLLAVPGTWGAAQCVEPDCHAWDAASSAIGRQKGKASCQGCLAPAALHSACQA